MLVEAAEIACAVASCGNSGGRSFHMTPRYTQSRLPHRFSPGSKLFFGTVIGWLTCWIVSYASYDMEHAAPGSVLHASRSSNASSGLPGPPAGGRGKDGRIITISSRLSTAAEREVASLCLCTVVITFCTSPFCVGVAARAARQYATPQALEFYLGAVVDLKGSPPCAAPSR